MFIQNVELGNSTEDVAENESVQIHFSLLRNKLLNSENFSLKYLCKCLEMISQNENVSDDSANFLTFYTMGCK